MLGGAQRGNGEGLEGHAGQRRSNGKAWRAMLSRGTATECLEGHMQGLEGLCV